MNISKESLDQLSTIIHYQKYAKYIPELKRRETWQETVERNKNMHITKYKDFPSVFHYIDKAYKMVLDKKIAPSMRSMQFGGTAILNNNNKMYNCCAVGIESPTDIADLFYLLLCGCGVGFSVRKNFIEKFPIIQNKDFDCGETYVVEDSIEGWADCVKHLFNSLKGGVMPEFDYKNIRPKGSLIKSSGCSAPGPEPLKKAINKIKELIFNLESENKYVKLRSIDIYDICCHLAEAVISGGIRRSACICLFDKDDELMLNSKVGAWWEKNTQRGMCNNSVQFDRDSTTKEEFEHGFEACKASGCGEPGFVWTSNNRWLVNPCCEVSMETAGFCNLSSINLAACKTQKDFEDACYYAAVIGTLQAGYSDLKYIDSKWQQNLEDSRLIGVSITGILGAEDLSKFDFVAGAIKVKEANRDISSLIGIEPAHRCTVIKPEGTLSLVFSTSSGIHPWHAKHYIRRVRVNKQEPIYKYFVENFPDMIEDDKMRSSDAVVSYYIKAPEGATTREYLTAKTFLDFIMKFNSEWISNGHRSGDNHNNVSCTVNVREGEWEDVKEWLWENRGTYTGISLLPYDNGTYTQAPFEEISEEEFNKNYIKREFDLSDIVEEKNYVDFGQVAACAGGGCEIF